MSKFKEGDLVYHRSNPKINMVVTYVDEEKDENDQKYQCTWLDLKGRIQVEDFDDYELEKPILL